MEQPEQESVTSLQQPETAAPPQAAPPQAAPAPAPEREGYSEPGSPVFDAEKVSCYYGSFRAVTDVSLTIYENEITAFIGPSGCGKTTVLAVPLGVLGAIYVHEYGGRGPLAQVVRFMADVMTGVPSIVMGLFIFSIWVLHFGYSGLAGAFALGCLMLPVVIRSSEEMLKLVPDPLREASYALGATKSRVTLTVVLPAAIGGIVSGALLAVARAAGETAPLLFTILTVTAANPNVFSGPNTALATQIFVNASQPFTGAQQRAWGAALTLIAIAFILMIAARIVTARFTRYSR